MSAGPVESSSDRPDADDGPGAGSPIDVADGPPAGARERRWQPLLEQWVLISAASARRPWSGATSDGSTAAKPAHDPGCYLCPRVVRANGAANPDYRGAYAFDNDFPSLSSGAPDARFDDPLLRTAPAHGRCRVLVWSERHDATLASLDDAGIGAAVRLWRDEYAHLAAEPGVANALVFENKGVEIGVSNLHPHGQVYATSFVTDTAARMRRAQATYARDNGGASLLQDLLRADHVREHLIVDSNERFSVMVPFAARFPYETWIVPHRPMRSLVDATEAELDALGPLYREQVRRYDCLFGREAPDVTLVHQAPTDDDPDDAHWCFHVALQPPLRNPTTMKFLAGFESGANNIVNPVRPEDAAAALRGVDTSDWAARFGPEGAA